MFVGARLTLLHIPYSCCVAVSKRMIVFWYMIILFGILSAQHKTCKKCFIVP